MLKPNIIKNVVGPFSFMSVERYKRFVHIRNYCTLIISYPCNAAILILQSLFALHQLIFD